MEIDLAGTKHGISERFAPDTDTGRLIEAEHVARYRWAAQAADGRKVLDAGCGTAYGAKLLAEAGAREVVGVDLAKGVLEAVAPSMPDAVRLEAGDLRQLAYEDGSFDLIVCFEMIEHFEEPSVVLDELVRVLAPKGLLLISSPNRGVFPAGDPHHRNEFQPQELRGALNARLRHVRLVRQHDYLLSAALSDESFVQGDGHPLEQIRVHKLVHDHLDGELYTLALASDGELPELGQLAALTGTLEFREWLSVFDEQTQAIRDKDNFIVELEARVGERDQINQLLLDAEQRLADVPTLHLQIADLRHELGEARAAADVAREQLRELDERFMRAQRTLVDMLQSPSWKLTKPLRAAKRRLRN
ncbi:MAG: class I SAM-dependent methyltransferase [Solirubrobacteraceae bacterium]